MTPDRSRFPERVYGSGSEPDVRFSLANERTFLAWISSALALISVGVALESLAVALQPQLRLASSLVLIGLGVVCPLQAWSRWVQVEVALRHNRPLPPGRLVLVLALGVGLAALLALLGVLMK
jgi:putative membrane protein